MGLNVFIQTTVKLESTNHKTRLLERGLEIVD